MGWLKKDEEDFDDSAAFDSDKGATLKIIFIVLVLIGFAVVIVIGYNQYDKWNNSGNETLNNTNGNGNGNVNGNVNGNDTDLEDGKVVINFTDFNLTVDENPEGLYYYTTKEKVTGEECFIDGKKKSCKSLTNGVCSKQECKKDLITTTECYVNNKKITCPK